MNFLHLLMHVAFRLKCSFFTLAQKIYNWYVQRTDHRDLLTAEFSENPILAFLADFKNVYVPGTQSFEPRRFVFWRAKLEGIKVSNFFCAR